VEWLEGHAVDVLIALFTGATAVFTLWMAIQQRSQTKSLHMAVFDITTKTINVEGQTYYYVSIQVAFRNHGTVPIVVVSLHYITQPEVSSLYATVPSYPTGLGPGAIPFTIASGQTETQTYRVFLKELQPHSLLFRAIDARHYEYQTDPVSMPTKTGYYVLAQTHI
jgi:hypothetical protein